MSIRKQRNIGTGTQPIDDGVHILTDEEGWQLFDREARRALGMSGEEFLHAWDAGEIDPNNPQLHNAVIGQLMLLPLVPSSRRSPSPRG